MQVVPGSHRLARQPRAAGTPFAFAQVEGRLRPHLQPVPLDAGQVLLYDHCLFHASGINHSTATRTAVAAVLVPSRDPLRMYRPTSVAGVVDAFEVPDHYHLDHDPGEVPDDAVFLGSVRVRIEASAGG